MGSLEKIALFGIGSTNCRSAVGDSDGSFLTEIRVEPTQVETLPAQALERLACFTDEVGEIDAVSFACGGPVEDGIVREMTGPDVFAAASDGDPVANDYLDRLCEYNAAGIGAVCNACNPDLLTIGGVGRSNFETAERPSRSLIPGRTAYRHEGIPFVQASFGGRGVRGSHEPDATMRFRPSAPRGRSSDP